MKLATYQRPPTRAWASHCSRGLPVDMFWAFTSLLQGRAGQLHKLLLWVAFRRIISLASRSVFGCPSLCVCVCAHMFPFLFVCRDGVWLGSFISGALKQSRFWVAFAVFSFLARRSAFGYPNFRVCVCAVCAFVLAFSLPWVTFTASGLKASYEKVRSNVPKQGGNHVR